MDPAPLRLVDGLGFHNTGFDFADFLLGLPETDSVYDGADRYYRGIAYSAGANDDFRFLPNLSFQLGLRYEYTSPLSEKYGREANLLTSPDYTGVPGSGSASVLAASCVGAILACAATPGVPSGMVKPQRLNFAPRLGLAWQAMKRGNLIVRTGYGTNYNGRIYNQVIGGTCGATQVSPISRRFCITPERREHPFQYSDAGQRPDAIPQRENHHQYGCLRPELQDPLRTNLESGNSAEPAESTRAPD